VWLVLFKMHPMSKTLQNTMFTLGTTACVANDTKHGVEIKQEPIVFGNEPSLHCPSHKSLFIDLCDSSSNDGTLLNSSYLSTSSPLIHLGWHEIPGSIPFLASTSTFLVLSVVDCLQTISWTPHIISR